MCQAQDKSKHPSGLCLHGIMSLWRLDFSYLLFFCHLANFLSGPQAVLLFCLTSRCEGPYSICPTSVFSWAPLTRATFEPTLLACTSTTSFLLLNPMVSSTQRISSNPFLLLQKHPRFRIIMGFRCSPTNFREGPERF